MKSSTAMNQPGLCATNPNSEVLNTSVPLSVFGFIRGCVTVLSAFVLAPCPAGAASLREAVQPLVEREYPSLENLYFHCHAHPELSFREEKTAERLAQELKALGI